MDDLVSQIQNILSTPEGQEQLKNIQSMLGMGGAGQNSTAPQEPSPAAEPAPPPAAAPAGGGNGGFDISQLTALLGSMGGNNSPGPAPQSSGPDLSGLASMLGGLGNAQTGSAPDGQQPAAAPAGGGFDLSGLAGMLGMGGAGPGGAADSGMPAIDMNMILKLQQVFKSMNVNDKNTQLLMALKPHFGEKRRGKVDQAISMMRLFSMLPALKESGIFAGL